MTTSTPGARHISPRPEDVRPRLSRLGKLDELTGQEPPVQRAANELIAAERQLSHVQTRYLEARRTGDPPSISLAASRQDGAIKHIERLRAQLYAERRRELLEAGADRMRFGPARRPSLMQRLLGR